MGRAPCCDKTKVKRGPWSPEEDTTLRSYIEKYGTGGNWIALPHKAGLKRCGKSCRLRWLNYLRPGIKHGGFTDEEDNTILTLYRNMGSRWSIIASHLPGRTDNDVKNYWNTKLKKKLLAAGAKGLEEVVNTSNPTTIVPINNSNSNSFTTKSSDFCSATSFNELQPNFCGNSVYPSTSSESLMQYSSMDHVIQGYPAGVVPDMLHQSTSTNQFTLPRLLDFEENGTPQNGLTTSSSQEISSLSPSYSFAKSYASWNDNVVADGVGFFMELESKLSDIDLLQNTQQEVNVSTEVDGSSLLNYCDLTEGGFLANISDNIVPSQGLNQRAFPAFD